MNEINIDLSVLTTEHRYNFRAQDSAFLTDLQLVDFHLCPWMYRKRTTGLVDTDMDDLNRIEDAAHDRILLGRDLYEQQWLIEEGGGYILGALERDKVELISSAVAQNDEAVSLLLYGKAYGVARTEYCGVQSQIRLDWVHPHRGIIEFKTCSDLTWFESDARQYGYHRQVAFYRAVLAQALGGTPVPVHLIAVEKREPFRCGVWRVGDDTLAQAQRENEAAIRRLLVCRERDEWPTGYEAIRELIVP